MKRPIFGIALLAACVAASAQIQSGTGIGSNTASGGRASTNDPPPLPTPSTSPRADQASTQSNAPRTPETSVGASGPTPDTVGRSSGRCDSLTGQERAQCIREQASTGTTGPGSTGGASGNVK